MSDHAQDEKRETFKFVEFFVRHRTAANLLMIAFLAVGLFYMGRINTQYFPTIKVPVITVLVPWPGASAEDVSRKIIERIEPDLRSIDGLEKVQFNAREGSGMVVLFFTAGADMQKALADAQQSVARATGLPEDSEKPIVSQVNYFEQVARVSVTGPFEEQEIKRYAKMIRDGLLEAGIDRVTLKGNRGEEIWVTVPEADLRRLNVTPSTIAAKIKSESEDLPSGTLSGDVERQIRAVTKPKSTETLGEVELKSTGSGVKVPLGDVAKISGGFDREAIVGWKQGGPAIELDIQRALSADTLKTMRILDDYLAKIKPTLPAGLKVEKYDVRGEYVSERLGVLVKNGLLGFALVLVILFLFLDRHVAFWVAFGIPVALMVTLGIMGATGQTMNMVSMFGLILMLGIIVDDAIVVGEHTATQQEAGYSAHRAAEIGASQMLMPVLAATLTTQAAFFPIFLVGDRIGEVIEAIPLVVITVLVASLLECFLILPGHLGGGVFRATAKKQVRAGFRERFDRKFAAFREGPFRRFLEFAFDWRYSTIATVIAVLIVSLGFLTGGRLKFDFFPSPDAERVKGYVVFGAGMPFEDQVVALQKIEDSLYKVEAELSGGKRGALVRSVYTSIGAYDAFVSVRLHNLAEMEVQLVPSEERSVLAETIERAWQDAVPKIPGVERVSVTAPREGPPGRDLEILLQDAPLPVMKKAANQVLREIQTYKGVSEPADDLPYGKPEIVMEITPRGTSMGFTTRSVGAQVRNSFEGAVGTRFVRDQEEVVVRVMRENRRKGMQALRELYVRSPSGSWVPLLEVVKIKEEPGFAIIRGRGGKRTVTVMADVRKDITSVGTVVDQLKLELVPKIEKTYGVTVKFAGREKERAHAFHDLTFGVYLAMLVIYLILAWVLASYTKPLAVMAIVPFGIVGAIIGHLVMGMDLTVLSLIALLGLSGILVNDSIILVTQVNRRLEKGDAPREAAIGASQDRLRAVVLTSITTIAGLLPMMFETSNQAQFLIPMVITLVFGLGVSTILVLVLVPILLGVGQDISEWFQDQKKRPELQRWGWLSGQSHPQR